MTQLFLGTVSSIMTKNPISVKPKTIGTEIVDIFENSSFHHLPVINDSAICIGVISKSDYYQLQDKFSRLKIKQCEAENEKFFKAVLASDIMTKDPVVVEEETPIKEIIRLFLKNEYHSVIVNKNGKCIGIVTPYDILRALSEIL